MEKDCGAWINLLSHKVKARLDAHFQNLGITGVQSRVIYYILAHCKEGPVFQRDIESAFGLSRSTATGILQLLEKNGIILRESVPNDARLKSLVPTQRAFELAAQVRACLEETDRMLTRGLSEGQIIMFREMAAQMLRNLDDWDACCCPEESSSGHTQASGPPAPSGDPHPAGHDKVCGNPASTTEGEHGKSHTVVNERRLPGGRKEECHK